MGIGITEFSWRRGHVSLIGKNCNEGSSYTKKHRVIPSSKFYTESIGPLVANSFYD